MPFTVSHVAAVLPFGPWLRRAGLLAAAVIGAMAPDFDLFLPWWLPRAATHGRIALLTFCLPVGLLAWVLFESLVRPALLAIAPDRWWAGWQRAGGADLRSLPTWLLAAAAILGGAITHLVWDGFTHEGARGVEMLPVLEAGSVRLAGHPMHLYRILQYLSSAAGLAIVAAYAWRWQRALPQDAPAGVRRVLPGGERLAWGAVLVAVPVVAGAAVALARLPQVGGEFGPGAWLSRSLEAGMGAAGAALLLVSVLVRVRVGGRKARNAGGSTCSG
jgi:hypothetical protein